MAGYQFVVAGTDKIELSTKAVDRDQQGLSEIERIEFKMNTIDDNTRNHADSVRAEIKICGPITADDKEVINKLAIWAMDSNKSTLYRDVELTVYEGENCTGKVLRKYQIQSMFVIDYTESFKNDESGTYELFIAQKEGKYKQEVFAK